MSGSGIPAAPKGTKAAGRRLWRSVLTEFDLAEHELSLLRRAVHVADICDELQAIVDAEGLMSTNRLGEAKAHPALVELRNQSVLLGRLIVALRVPLGEQDEAESASPRGGQLRAVRGVYSPRGAA